jgi:hypothetical protein
LVVNHIEAQQVVERRIPANGKASFESTASGEGVAQVEYFRLPAALQGGSRGNGSGTGGDVQGQVLEVSGKLTAAQVLNLLHLGELKGPLTVEGIVGGCTGGQGIEPQITVGGKGQNAGEIPRFSLKPLGR